jgi:hypothetical protein
MNQIPQSESVQIGFRTRNTKEAALLYAFNEVTPTPDSKGRPFVFRAKVKEDGAKDFGEDVTWFSFQDGKLANQIHAAFEDKEFTLRQHAPIPDELVPSAIALVLQVFHNFERCRDVCKTAPLHGIVVKGGKVIVAGVPT